MFSALCIHFQGIGMVNSRHGLFLFFLIHFKSEYLIHCPLCFGDKYYCAWEMSSSDRFIIALWFCTRGHRDDSNDLIEALFKNLTVVLLALINGTLLYTFTNVTFHSDSRYILYMELINDSMSDCALDCLDLCMPFPIFVRVYISHDSQKTHLWTWQSCLLNAL